MRLYPEPPSVIQIARELRCMNADLSRPCRVAVVLCGSQAPVWTVSAVDPEHTPNELLPGRHEPRRLDAMGIARRLRAAAQDALDGRT